MVKQYKRDKGPYFYHEQMLAKGGTNPKYKLFIVIGSKNIGKTTSFLRGAIKDAIDRRFDNEGKFLLVLRRELQADEYGDKTTAQGDWFKHCKLSKGRVIEGQGPRAKRSFPIGRIMSLSGSFIGQSKENAGYDKMIVDDFVPHPGEMRIKNAGHKLRNMFSNFCRKNITEARMILTGNNNRPDAELFDYFRVQPVEGGGIIDRPDVNMVMYCEGFRTPHGIISPQHKKFEHTALAGIPEDELDYLTANKNLSEFHDYVRYDDVLQYEPLYCFIFIYQEMNTVVEYGTFVHKKTGVTGGVMTRIGAESAIKTTVKIALGPECLGVFDNTFLPKQMPDVAHMIFRQMEAGAVYGTNIDMKQPMVTTLKRFYGIGKMMKIEDDVI